MKRHSRVRSHTSGDVSVACGVLSYKDIPWKELPDTTIADFHLNLPRKKHQILGIRGTRMEIV